MKDDSNQQVQEKYDIAEIYRILTEEVGLRLDSKDKDENTPLHLAIASQNFKFLDLTFHTLEKDKYNLKALLA